MVSETATEDQDGQAQQVQDDDAPMPANSPALPAAQSAPTPPPAVEPPGEPARPANGDRAGQRGGFLGQSIFGRTVRGLFRSRRGFDPATIHPDLPDADLDLVRGQIEISIAARGGEVAARAEAAALGRAYLTLSETGRLRFFRLLAERYDIDVIAVRQASDALAVARDPEAAAAARRALRQATTSPRMRLFLGFNSLDEGVKFLVTMRRDLVVLVRHHPELRAVDDELFELLRSWFDVGFLQLTRVTWDTSASLLEKLMAYEAVHKMRSWEDLKNRLHTDRRVFAFFHPSMTDEPLIFVQIALVNGMADAIPPLLERSGREIRPDEADTAIFYSISNAQRGLAGVSFGDFLIKRVVERLSHEFPNLKTFATLSPIPGFRRWLMAGLGAQGADFLTPGESQALTKAFGEAMTVAGFDGLVAGGAWLETDNAAKVRPVLMKLVARYLTTQRGGRETLRRALDPVTHFHLTNGARVERINWMGDPSDNGLSQSYGLMVNYLYRLSDIEDNHEAYRLNGEIRTSNPVRNLAG